MLKAQVCLNDTVSDIYYIVFSTENEKSGGGGTKSSLTFHLEIF